MKALLVSVLFVCLIGLSGAATAATYSVTVHTDSQSYVGASNVLVSGQVSPAPGPNTAVFIRVFNPGNVMVTAFEANVNGTSGDYSGSFVAGGTTSWTAGTYVVNATWGAYGSAVIFSTASFVWSTTATTTTTTATTTTTTSSTTTTTTTTTSSTTSRTTTTTTTSTPSTTTTTTTTTSSSSQSSSSSGGGGIPEFPFQAGIVAIVTALVAVAYLAARRRVQPAGSGTAAPI